MTVATNTLLDAGALVPFKTKIKDPQHVDEISARVYHHPALGDRPVVRLSADNLAQGDDLEMEFLGFETPQVNGPLAYRRRQALGFPGWALIHDPDHARYALELVKEFKKAARKSKSKPGHGYDAYVDIAKRLGKSVAHFLPSFWEQVGREFIQIGNSTYASRAFGKAREAEKVHALKVDEKLRQDAFLEFALAGCLSNKALTEYGKELQASLSGEEAWKSFRELCVRRTLGGMPPWTSMASDLKPLIAGANLDVDQEMKSVLAEILESPAMSRAGMGFWKASSKYVQELASENDRAAGQLLNLMPETNRWNRENAWAWLEFLEQTGILPNAWNEGVSEEAGPEGGAAAWFSRWSVLSDEPPQRLFDVLAAIAPRLKKEKKPINLTVEGWGSHSINVDLLDLALELKVPVAEPPENTEMNLVDWAKPEGEAQNRPRDPVFVHKHDRYAKMLEQAVPNAAGNADFEAAAKGKTALAAARKNWLMGLIDQIAEGGLPSAEIALNHLQTKTSRETYREFPEAYEKLKTIDLAPVLGRTLAGGVIDEYGWPIVEEVADRLGNKGKHEVTVYGQFPYVILTDGLKVVVVDHERIVLEHEVKLAKKAKLDDLLFYDGQLCVFCETDRYKNYFYWSGNPKKTTELWYYSHGKIGGAVVDLKDGGTFNGRKTIHAGDTEGISKPNHFLFDGEHFWKLSWREEGHGFREFDPDTAKEGRWSMPSFLEDYLKTGDELIENFCELLSLGDAVSQSPLGSQDGKVGWRVRKTQAGKIECEGIDGRRWSGGLQEGTAVALADQPGSSERLPITGNYGWSWGYVNCQLWDPTGSYSVAEWGDELGAYNRGQAASFPPLFWHAFKLRDKKVSKTLRSTNQAQAKKLFDAVQKDLEQADETEDPISHLPGTEAALKKWLSGLKDQRLLKGLLGVIHKAGEQAGRLSELIETCDPEGAESFSFDPALESLVEPAMKVFDIHTGWGDTKPLFPHLAEVRAFIAGEKKSPIVSEPPFDWWQLLDHLETRVWSAYWTAASGNDAAWLKFLEHWAELGLLDLPGKFRRLEGEFDGPPPVKSKSKKNENDWIGHLHQGNVYFLSQRWDEDWSILEYAPQGKFHLLPKYTIDSEEKLETAWTGETLKAFIKEARANEKPFLDPPILASIANRLGVTAAEVGLIWLGFPNFDSWEKNFLFKPLREMLNLKVAEAEAARQSLKALPDEARQKLLETLLGGPPADLWAEGGGKAIERLCAAWEKLVPKRLVLPPKVLEQLTDAFPYHVDKGQALAALAAPKSHAMFSAEADWCYGKPEGRYWTELTSDKQGETFDNSILTAAAISVPFLSYHLPVGEPARQDVPAMHQAALKCLKSQKLLLPLTQRHTYDEKDQNAGKTLLEKTLGKKSQKQGDGWTADEGLVMGYAEGYQTHLAFRPAKLKTDKEFERLGHMYNLLFDVEESEDSPSLESVKRIRSDGYQAICDRIKKTPVPEGGYETNPELSVPDLVAEAEKKQKLSREAAVLYLQLLTLPDCTTANVKVWNDWTTAKFNKAAKELEKKKLVLSAKRARAGRNYFLPGGWEALKIPHLPIETWKLPLYEITRTSDGKLSMPLDRILPLRPVHELFQAAWQRILASDEPAYEEVS